jgi:hypothetical protein
VFNVFGAASCDKVYGTFFFGEKTVDGIIYRDMLELWLMPQLLEDKSNVVFEHDGALPHVHNEVTTSLNRQLPERWIGQGGSTSWPPRSPDLTPLDFFLWGFVKDEVHVPPMPITLKNLKDRIRTAIAKIYQSLLQKLGTMSNIVLMCAGQQMDHVLNLHRVWKKVFELLFTVVCV